MIRTIRRILAFLAAGALLLVLLCACSAGSDPKKTDEAAPKGSGLDSMPVPAETQIESKNDNSFWSKLPRIFAFTDGLEEWKTTIALAPDGSFTGEYRQSAENETDAAYPGGTTYICAFKGAFTEPEARGETVFTTTLLSIKSDQEAGTEWIENGTRYVTAEPYGFQDAGLFFIYLPGTPANQMAEGFFPWAELDATSLSAMPEGLYGIYNLNANAGFIGE